MKNSNFQYRLARVFAFACLLLGLAQTGNAQSSLSVNVSQSGNNVTVSTNGLGPRDLVFYRFSDGYHLTALQSDVNPTAAVTRQFKGSTNQTYQVTAYVARKGGTLDKASVSVPNVPACPDCTNPKEPLEDDETIRLGSSWLPFSAGHIVNALTDATTNPALVTPHQAPWLFITATMKKGSGDFGTGHADIHYPSQMQPVGVIVGDQWLPFAQNSIATSGHPNITGVQFFQDAGKVSIFLSNLSSDIQTNVYLLMRGPNASGEWLDFYATLFNKDETAHGESGKLSIFSQRNPHDPNRLYEPHEFPSYICTSRGDNSPVRFRVDFQNLGAGPAKDVDVVLFVDETIFNPNGVSNIQSSHFVQFGAQGNKLVFGFPDIDLPGTAQTLPHSYPLHETIGWVEFDIKTQECIQDYLAGPVYTKGHVVFSAPGFKEVTDLNEYEQKVTPCPRDEKNCPYELSGTFPIKPLLANNGNQPNATAGAVLNCYPTLFNNTLTLHAQNLQSDEFQTLTLTDRTGRHWQTANSLPQPDGTSLETWNLGHLPSGMYIVRLSQEGQSVHCKVLKH